MGASTGNRRLGDVPVLSNTLYKTKVKTFMQESNRVGRRRKVYVSVTQKGEEKKERMEEGRGQRVKTFLRSL